MVCINKKHSVLSIKTCSTFRCSLHFLFFDNNDYFVMSNEKLYRSRVIKFRCSVLYDLPRLFSITRHLSNWSWVELSWTRLFIRGLTSNQWLTLIIWQFQQVPTFICIVAFNHWSWVKPRLKRIIMSYTVLLLSMMTNSFIEEMQDWDRDNIQFRRLILHAPTLLRDETFLDLSTRKWFNPSSICATDRYPLKCYRL